MTFVLFSVVSWIVEVHFLLRPRNTAQHFRVGAAFAELLRNLKQRPPDYGQQEEQNHKEANRNRKSGEQVDCWKAAHHALNENFERS
jgi:hypothetical protein